MKPFTNSHIHVFNSECAPQNFLRILDKKIVRTFPGFIKWLLQTRRVRTAIWWLSKRLSKKSGKRRSTLAKYISFLNVGTQRSQKEVFEIAYNVAKKYDSNARIIGLTMDMDHMDNQGKLPDKPLETQLAEVKALKRFYPRNFYPFLGVDPRTRSGSSLVEWAKKFLERGVIDRQTGKVHPYFYGIKLYPALGFFPFDPRLDELYAYASAKGIPIMSHCTRSGSFYVGNAIESLIPTNPAMISPTDAGFAAVQQRIYDRIDRYYTSGLIKNHKKGANDLSCDLFGHPENYEPIMMKYPDLKICLAHVGGTDEIKWIGEPLVEKWQIADGQNWSELLGNLLAKYPKMYADISYTLAALEDTKIKKYINDLLPVADVNENAVGDRILFGTDFYMTEQEEKEEKLYQLAAQHIPSTWFDKLTRDNPDKYLF